MTKVIAGASMSLDGFIAGPDETGFEHLFRWLGNGDVEVPTANPGHTLRMSAVDAEYLREQWDTTGAIVVGRRLFDLTGGWGGAHPIGRPVVVVTHEAPAGWEDTPFTFVTDGVTSAIERAKALAGDGWVGVNGGTMARQCLEAGLLDTIGVDLVPVVLGKGVPLFGELANAPVLLGAPEVVAGSGVTHLRYDVLR